MKKKPARARKAQVSAGSVAELAGVSRSAVSRTFTDGASVSKKTRAKVLAAATALGYHVNHLARGLIRHQSGIVCVVVAEIQTPFQASLVETTIRRLQAMRKVVMVLSTAGNPDEVEAALHQTLHYRADATIVVSGTPPRSLIDTCIDHGQRVILINRDDYLDGPRMIMIDNEAAATEAFQLLHRAGCDRLAVVSSTAGTPSLVARETAFVAAARQGGVAVQVVRAGPTGYAAGVDGARQLFAASIRPNGAFCVTDLIATGFIDAARQEFQLSVPDDLCVIGFDDIPTASWLSYQLTTFRQPLQQIADHIAHLLDADEAEPGLLTRFPAQIVWRKSVRP